MTTAEPDPAAQADAGAKSANAKSAARLYAVQALFQMEASGQGVDRVRNEFESHRFGAVYEGDENGRRRL